MTERDVTENYHHGHPNSRIAHGRTNRARDLARIEAYILNKDIYGATDDEINTAFFGGTNHQTASARGSDLRNAGIIIPLSELPEGSSFPTARKRLTRKNCPADVCIHKTVWERDIGPAPKPLSRRQKAKLKRAKLNNEQQQQPKPLEQIQIAKKRRSKKCNVDGQAELGFPELKLEFK